MILSLILALAAHAKEGPAFIQEVDNRAQALYEPLMKKGESFAVIHKPGMDQSLVGSALRNPVNEFRVVFDSGFVKTPRLTPDGYRFALCHELGHLFGGVPRRDPPMEWDGPMDPSGKMLLSGEAQADYYAGRACFRKLVEGENHAKALAGREIPDSLRKDCNGAWGKGSQDSLICLRTAVGSFDMLRLVFDFKISLDAKDPEVVEKTIESAYPSRQCRLDTAIAGALCSAPVGLDLNGHDVAEFGCARGVGARPACWYK
jgi:hypothetical protein